jgi:hypothetical protein
MHTWVSPAVFIECIVYERRDMVTQSGQARLQLHFGAEGTSCGGLIHHRCTFYSTCRIGSTLFRIDQGALSEDDVGGF